MKRNLVIIIILATLIFGISILFPVNANENTHISYYASLLANNNQTYSYEGDLCGKTESNIIFGKTLEDDKDYLCKIKKGGSGNKGSKTVTIELTNLGGSYCDNIRIRPISKDDKENKLQSGNTEYTYLDNNNSFTFDYTYGVDYSISISCLGFDDYTFVDNLKDSDMKESTVKRQITLKRVTGFEQDLNLQQLSDKIKSDNSIRTDTPDFSKLSPTVVTYSETTTSKTYNLRSNYSYCYGTSYTFNDKTGRYKLNDVSCFPTTQKSPIGLYTCFSTYSPSSSTDYSTIYKVNNVSTTQDGYYDVTFYGSTPATDDTGLFSDNGNYYFRGVVNNNYVKFANKIWRIVRINNDKNKSIRLILDGDIGSTTWNDNFKYEYYMGFTYGDISYQPITSSSSKQVTEDPSTNNYCYSDNYILDSKNLTFKLTGDIICKQVPKSDSEMNGKYTILNTSRTATADKMYKISNYFRKNDSETCYSFATTKFYIPKVSKSNSYELYYADNYTIENGLYKLVNPQKWEQTSSDYYSYTKRNKLVGKYTFNSKNKLQTSSTMYKITENGSYASQMEGYKFVTPTYSYTNGTAKNNSNPKKMLDNWYKSNLNDYNSFITISSFCNDTTKGAATRLALDISSVPKPTFDCPTGATYGGTYNTNIGLITADEMVFAGAVPNKVNNNYWLAYDKPFWTMTPYGLYGYNPSFPSMFASTISNSYNNLGYSYSDTVESLNGLSVEPVNKGRASQSYLYAGDPTLAVRPVINLRPNVCIYSKNDGTRGNPYEVITDYNIINVANSSEYSSRCY